MDLSRRSFLGFLSASAAAAVIPIALMPESPKEGFHKIPVEWIQDGFTLYDDHPYEEKLKEDIRVRGLMVPIRVDHLGPFKYRCFDGTARLRAVRSLGHKEITVQICELKKIFVPVGDPLLLHYAAADVKATYKLANELYVPESSVWSPFKWFGV
jgi:hypothetical protein